MAPSPNAVVFKNVFPFYAASTSISRTDKGVAALFHKDYITSPSLPNYTLPESRVVYNNACRFGRATGRSVERIASFSHQQSVISILVGYRSIKNFIK